MSLDALFENVAAAPPTAMGQRSAEDMALCAAFLQAGGAARLPDLARALEERIEAWKSLYPAPRPESASERHQPVLRELMDAVMQDGAPSLGLDELTFLSAAHDLMRAAKNNARLARPQAYLDELRPDIDARLAELPALDSLPNLGKRIHFVTPEGLEAAPPRQAQEFAGIECPILGPVFTHGGRLRVLGDVPDHCTVAVENGDCFVSGYVLGNVAATGSIEVLGNVSGRAIARTGDIRLRDIINRATLISKQGQVVCREAKAPDLVYAFDAIEIAGDVRGGVFVAPSIIIAGECRGATLHVAHEASASLFTPEDQAPANIVLRRMVSHEDYGEIVPREVTRAAARAHRARWRLRELAATRGMMWREREQFARNLLLYLAGGDRAQRDMQALEQAQRRLAFLDRIIGGVEGMVHAVDQRLAAKQRHERGGGEVFIEEEDWERVLRELRTLEEEQGDSPDTELASRRNEFIEVQRNLRGKNLYTEELARMLAKLGERVKHWRHERTQQAAAVEKLHAQIRESVGRAAVLQRAEEHGAYPMLQQLLHAMRRQPKESSARARFQTPFARIMLRHLTTRTRSLEQLAGQERACQEEYAALRNTLQQEHGLRLPGLTTGEATRARVSGSFAAGVRIFAAMHTYERSAGGEPGVLVTGAHTGHATFVQGASDTVERL
ncbi:MAG: hypothetical protein ACLFTT_16970 [Candidatus Hydrogenedentota bacterium]